MQKGKAVFFGIVMILVNFCIAVCIQGLLFCPISSPLQAESLAKAYGEFENAHIRSYSFKGFRIDVGRKRRYCANIRIAEKFIFSQILPSGSA